MLSRTISLRPWRGSGEAMPADNAAYSHAETVRRYIKGERNGTDVEWRALDSLDQLVNGLERAALALAPHYPRLAENLAALVGPEEPS